MKHPQHASGKPASLPSMARKTTSSDTIENHSRKKTSRYSFAFLLFFLTCFSAGNIYAQCNISSSGLLGIGASFPANFEGQTFTAPCSGVITQITFGTNSAKLYQIKAFIRSTNCTGTILGSANTPGNAVNGTNTVTFSPGIYVTAGSVNAIRLQNASGSGTIDGIRHYILLGGYSGGASCNSGTDLIFSVTINACVMPAFTSCPSNLTTTTAPGVCNKILTYSAAAGGLPAPTMSYQLTGATVHSGSGTGSGLAFNKGVTNVQLTSTNQCGTANCSFTITVNDDQAPVVNCSNTTISCNASTLPANTGTPTVTDNCGPGSTLSYNDATTAGSCPGNYTITRTWTAVDNSGNTGSCAQTITVQDIIAPSIICPPAITISCNDSQLPSSTGAATATDNCDANPSIGYTDAITAGSCPGNYTIARTWTATDNCVNSSSCVQTISVQDISAPSISCPAAITINCGASQFPANTGAATATDNCDANPSVGYTDATTAGSCAGNYTIVRTWTATDNCGNSSSCMQIISVQDISAPVISCAPAITISCDASQLPSSTGSTTATDNCDANPIVGYSDAVTAGSCAGNYTIARTWTATDDCGNSSSCVQTISVQDISAPAINCAPAITISCNGSQLPSSTGVATATDNCDANPSIGYTDATAAGSCPGNYTISRTWTATDNCGNSSSCVQAISVQDITAPSVICPAAVMISCDASQLPSSTGIATAADNCDAAPSVSHSDTIIPGSGPGNYTISRTWTAMDNCGNSASCVQTISVQDILAPVPDLASLPDVSGVCTATVSSAPTATDNCAGTITGTTSDPLNYNSPGSYVVHWVFDDGNGNSSTQNQNVTVFPMNASITISGPIMACIGNPVTYTASITDGGTSPAYQWYMDGIPVGTNSSSFDTVFSASAIINAQLTSNAPCAIPAIVMSNSISVMVAGQVPPKAGAVSLVSGGNQICPGDTASYSIAPVPTAAMYIWTPPTGGVVISGHGTTAVTVAYNSLFTDVGPLTVIPVNGCGNGKENRKSIGLGPKAAIPADIFGANFGVCNNPSVAYSVNAVPGETYTWSFDNPDATVVSGQGTSSIVASYNASFITGLISVQATNGCGSRQPKSMGVLARPAEPDMITGPSSVCPGQQGVAYSVPAVFGATSYTWISPATSTVSDGINTSLGNTFNTPANAVTINFGANGGLVKVSPSNACGTGGQKTTSVTIVCPPRMVNGIEYLNLFPNPAKDQLNIMFYANEVEAYTIRIIDAQGREVISRQETATAGSNQQTVDVSALVAGIYQLMVQGLEINYKERFIVE